MSEYGFQSFPQIETVNTYTEASDRDIKSPVMMAHQRHPRGNQLIREYMLRDYPEPKDFDVERLVACADVERQQTKGRFTARSCRGREPHASGRNHG